MSASARRYSCECGRRSCKASVRITVAEYTELRRANLSVVAAGHESGPRPIVQQGIGWVALGRRSPEKPAEGPLPADVTRFCPTCDEWTLPGAAGRCLWCGGECADQEAAA